MDKDKKESLKSQSQSQSQSLSQSHSTERDTASQKRRQIPASFARGVEETERSNRPSDAKNIQGRGGGEAVSVGFSQSTTTSSGSEKQSRRACPPTTAPRNRPSHSKNDTAANTNGIERIHDQSDGILPLPSLSVPREEGIVDGLPGHGDGEDVIDNHNDESDQLAPSPPVVGSVLSSALPNNSASSNRNHLREERVYTSSVLVGDMQARVQQQQDQQQQQQLLHSQQQVDNDRDHGLAVARRVEDEEHHDLYDQILIEDARPHREVHHHVWIIVLVVVSIFIVILGVTLGVTASNKNKLTPTTTPTTAPAPTLAPTTLPDMNQIALDFRQILREETWQAIQNNSSSPQAKGYAWVTRENQPLLYGRDPVQRMTQRFALATLYYATGGESHWGNAPGWLNYSVSECDWWGCSCNISTTTTSRNASKMNDDFSSSKQVTIRTLTLKTTGSLSLSGTIPPEIGLLTNLMSFRIESSLGVTGPIPTQLSRLSHLTCLVLGEMGLTGTIPSEISQLTSLENLNMANNIRLGGSIMTDFGLLTNLRELGLGTSSLSGTIPTEIGRLANLGYLGLAGGHVKLNGTLPTELFLLTNLYELQLNQNALTGTISSQLGLSMRNLRRFYLDHNQFTGSLPSTLGLLSSLEWFFVNDNAITGSVPRELCNLVSLGLEFHVDCNHNVTCDCDCLC